MALCVICGSTGDEKTVTLGQKGIAGLQKACDDRGEKLLSEKITQLCNTGQTITAHKECRRIFTLPMKPPPAKRAKHTNTTANDEKKAVKHHTPGRPACPKSAAAFKKTCQWLRCSDRPKSLQEVVGHMAQQVGEASSWSSIYLMRNLKIILVMASK